MHLRLVSISISLFIATLLSAQTDTVAITFEQAYETMQAQNPALKSARQAIRQKEYEKSAKQALYMPKVSLSASAVSMSEPIGLDLTEIRDAITPIYEVLGHYGVFDGVPYVNPETGEVMAILDQEQSTSAVRQQLLAGEEEIAAGDWEPVIQEADFATVSAGFTWPVFTGGKIAAVNKAANTEIAISQQDLRKTEAELMNELVTRYYGLTLTQQVAAVMKEKLEAVEHHYSDAEKMHREGMIAKIELLNAAVALSDARRDSENAKRMVNTTRIGLSSTLNISSDTCTLPLDRLFINHDIKTSEFWINTAWENNPSLQQIDLKTQLVDIKTQVSKGDYLPTIALMGTVNIAEHNLSPYTPEWLVGAGMSWTIFDGLSRNKQVKINKSLQQQVGHIRHKAQNDITAYITKQYNLLVNNLLEIEELENTMSLAEEYASSTAKAFKEGFANSASVVEAQSKLSQVKALRLKAYYEYDITLAALLQITGTPERFPDYATGEQSISQSIQ